jgi:hypothetical protein
VDSETCEVSSVEFGAICDRIFTNLTSFFTIQRFERLDDLKSSSVEAVFRPDNGKAEARMVDAEISVAARFALERVKRLVALAIQRFTSDYALSETVAARGNRVSGHS